MPKFLPLKGPRGTYYQAWMSRADQSFMSTKPNIDCSASFIGTGLPMGLLLQSKQPSSNSISRRREGPNVGIFGSAVGSSRSWPLGRRMGVPETTTVDARPWYPMGMW